MDLAAVKMDFRYDDWFAREQNVGYETLLYDVMVGDQTLFMRADLVEQAWRIVQPVLDDWAAPKRIPQLRFRQHRSCGCRCAVEWRSRLAAGCLAAEAEGLSVSRLKRCPLPSTVKPTSVAPRSARAPFAARGPLQDANRSVAIGLDRRLGGGLRHFAWSCIVRQGSLGIDGSAAIDVRLVQRTGTGWWRVSTASARRRDLKSWKATGPAAPWSQLAERAAMAPSPGRRPHRSRWPRLRGSTNRSSSAGAACSADLGGG